MRHHEASRTAEFMAVFRASEHAKAPASRAFADPLAAALLPGELRLAARLFGLRPAAALLNGYIDRRWPGARTSGIARTKLIDDWIGQAADGIDQVVLLGAGFDTRAWRLNVAGIRPHLRGRSSQYGGREAGSGCGGGMPI